MKINLVTFLFIIITTISCSSDSDSSDSNNNGNTNATYTTVVFENSSFSGSALITFSDGTTQTSNFISGLMKIPLSANANKIIASIQPENQNFILIGRREGGSIKLNYNLGTLSHRIALNGFVPIGTYAELQLINANSSTLSATYKLEYDLDLMGIQWTPIGSTSLPFKGNFDGDNHRLLDLSVNSSYGGLFGFATSYPLTQYIRNLIIDSGDIICTGGSAGGIIGTIEGAANISNCQNYAWVEAEQAGGIIGSSNNSTPTVQTTIINCQNFGSIKGEIAGGIAARSGQITDCQNNGSVGVVSTLNPSNNGFTSLGGIGGICIGNIIRCSNNGNIFSDKNGYLGGICGYSPLGDIIDCFNIGRVTSNSNSAGIVGSFISNTSRKLVACYNVGEITGAKLVGGIISELRGSNCTVEACYNAGQIFNNSPRAFDIGTGGLIGYVLSASSSNSLKCCYNTGELICALYSDGMSQSGELIGQINNYLFVSNCYWKNESNDISKHAIGQMSNNGIISYNLNSGTSIFDSTEWPTSSQNWLIGNGTNEAYWKSLGSWNNGNPIYPQLHFEN